MKLTVNSYYRNHKTQVLLWLCFSAVVSVLSPLKTFQLKWLIDSSSKNEALFFIGVSLLIVIFSHISEFLCRKVYAQIATNAVHEVRTAIIEKALHRTYVEYNSDSDASYLSMLSSDVRILFDDYYMGIFEVVFWGGIMIVALCMFYYLNPLLLLVAALISVPPLVIPKIANARLVRVRSEYSNEMEKYTEHVKEVLGGYEVIRNFLCEAFFIGKHCEYSRNNSKKEYHYQQNVNYVMIGYSFISILTQSLMLLVAMMMVYDGKISLGTVTSATSLIAFVNVPCQRVTQAYAKMKGTKGVRDKFAAAMNKERDEDAAKASVEDASVVKCQNVQFVYPGTSKKVLDNVSMKLGKNEKVAIIGESGCGKSTLAKLLYQYYPEYEGTITYGSCDLKKADRCSLYKKVGYLSQSTFLFNDSIRNNISLFEPFSDEQIQNAINLAGLRRFVDSLPDGADSILQENGKNISGGQRQRIGIARMIVRQYEMVIADEITANLDMETTEQVMSNLLALSCSMVVITHNITGEYMNHFDKVYRLENSLTLVPAH